MTFFVHEIGQVLRGRGMWWKRAGYLVFSSAFVIGATYGRGYGRADGLAAFRILMGLNAYVAYMLAAGTFSKCISGPREAGSLELLRITALSPLALLLGTGTTLFVRTLLFFLAQFPLAVFCISLGELSYNTVLGGYTLAAAVLFFLCHVGVYWSVVGKSSRHAGISTVFTAAFLYLGPALVTFIGRPSLLDFPPWIIEPLAWLGAQNPLSALTTLGYGGAWPISSILLHFALGGAFLAAAVWRFDSICELREGAPSLESRPGLTQKARRRPVPRVQGHPIAWKEFHFAAGGARARQLRWIGYLALAAFAAFVSREIWIGSVIVGAAGLFIELPLAVTKVIGAEVQQRTLGDLAVLPIHPWRIVFEKIRGHLPVLAPALLLTFVGIVLSEAPWDKLSATPEFWLIPIYAVWQVAFLFILTIYLSLTQPIQAYGTSFVFVLLSNVAVLNLLARFVPKSFPLILLLPMALSGWLGCILIRAFPTTFYQAATK